jgi:hypothetical protein
LRAKRRWLCNERELQKARIVATRVPRQLYEAIERDAAKLGVSIADATRMRLTTGYVPALYSQSHPSRDQHP